MKKWLEYFYGTEKLPDNAILCAGTTSKGLQERVISEMGKVVHHRDDVHQYFVIRRNNNRAIVIFNLTGASCIIDVIHLLGQGGCRKNYFIGFAGTREDFEVGDLFLPEGVRCLDGVTNFYNPNLDVILTDQEVMHNIQSYLKNHNIRYNTGLAASVPAVFHHNEYVEQILNSDQRIKAYEMELSSVLYFSKINGVQCAPVLIISDNKKKEIPYTFQKRENVFYTLFNLISEKIIDED